MRALTYRLTRDGRAYGLTATQIVMTPIADSSVSEVVFEIRFYGPR